MRDYNGSIDIRAQLTLRTYIFTYFLFFLYYILYSFELVLRLRLSTRTHVSPMLYHISSVMQIILNPNTMETSISIKEKISSYPDTRVTHTKTQLHMYNI